VSAHEPVDLVDTAGRVVVRGVPRSEWRAHAGAHLPIVSVVVRDGDGRILVQGRAADKTYAGLGDHVYGAVHAGEEAAQTAHREVREETGVELKSLRLVESRVNEGGEYHTLFAGLAADPGAARVNSPGEVSWVAWYRVTDLLCAVDADVMGVTPGFFEDIAATEEGPDPTADILIRLDGQSDMCESQPPETLYEGDGWYDEETGLTLHDEDGQPFAIEEHVCGDQ
jgi:8-oxo-dGTP pyrophosphatase MutT (NUDIX family)